MERRPLNRAPPSHTNSFSVGTAPPPAKRKRKIFPPNNGPPPVVNLDNTAFSSHKWLIIPRVPCECQYTINNAGKNIVQITTALFKMRRLLTLSKAIPDQTFVTPYTPTVKLINRSLYFAVKNEVARRRFGNIARRWILSRLANGNDDDLLTGEPPVNPITLIDFENRRKYVFEPNTLLRDIGSRLVINVYGEFPSPKPPRNPYTNLDITSGQFFSIYRQMRANISTNWMLESLYSVHYDISRFTTEMYGKLRHTLVRTMFLNHSDSNGKRLLVDFIDEFHEKNDCDCDIDTYEWAVDNAPRSKRIMDWRNACYMYHIQQLSPSKTSEKEGDKLQMSITRLCSSRPGELIRLKLASEEPPCVEL